MSNQNEPDFGGCGCAVIIAIAVVVLAATGGSGFFGTIATFIVGPPLIGGIIVCVMVFVIAIKEAQNDE